MLRPYANCRLRDEIPVIGFYAFMLFMIFGSTFLFPYRLADDNWILRGFDPRGSYPSLEFVALVQGRPLFAVMLWLSRRLSDMIGIHAIVAIRLAGVLVLSVCIWQMSILLRNIGWSRNVAILSALTIGTLPSFQIIITGGPWLAVPLMLSLSACIIIERLPRDNLDYRYISAAIAMIVAAFSVYQSIPFVIIAFLFVMLLSKREASIPEETVRAAVYAVVILFVSLAVYYATWRVAFNFVQSGVFENRYNPTSYNTKIAERIAYFFERRVPHVLSLWYVNNSRIWIYSIPAIVIISLGLMSDALVARQKFGMYAALKRLTIVVVAAAVSFLAADFAAIVSSAPQSSFTTSVALSTLVGLLIAWSISSVTELVVSQTIALKEKVQFASIACLAAVGCILANNSTLVRFSMPLWMTSEIIKSSVLIAREAGNNSKLIHVFERSKFFDPDGRSEFGWSNLNDPFYIRWMTKNALRDIGLSDDVKIVVFGNDGEIIRTFPASFELDHVEKPIIADMRLIFPGQKELSALRLKAAEDRDKVNANVIALVEALLAGESAAAMQVLSRSVAAEGPQFVSRTAPNGKSLLGVALCADDLAVARRLIEQGADPNTGRLNGASQSGLPKELPFECAQNISAIELLVSSGMSEAATNRSGFTPLHVLVEKNMLKEAGYLLRRGYSANIKQGDHRIPLHTAAYYGYLEMMKLLLVHGSDISSRDHAGSTPEAWARSQGKQEAVELLRQSQR